MIVERKEWVKEMGEKAKERGGEGGDGRLTVMEIPADMKAKGQCIFFFKYEGQG